MTNNAYKVRMLLKRYISCVKETMECVDSLRSNVFKTDYSKNVLLSYITTPFFESIQYGHTNYVECYEIAKIFSGLGYNVDVINFDDESSKIDYYKYSVLCGFGEPLEKSFYQENTVHPLTIVYAPGCDTVYSNAVSLRRVLEVYHKMGVLIPHSARLVNKSWRCQMSFSDAIIVLGNKFTVNTFRTSNINLKIFSLPIFFHKVMEIDLTKKDFSKARSHFLWFGGSGLIHKGLDIVLEIFKKRKDIILHVCGPVEGERVFQKTYYNYLYNTPNIKTYGFVNINSEKFRKLMQACAFTIYPSASEGSSPSVVVVMGNGGLIPILSNASGLDVEEFGFVFEEINHETVEKYIENALELTDGELFERSLDVLRFADTHHGFENYSRRMEEIIIEILGTKRNAV